MLKSLFCNYLNSYKNSEITQDKILEKLGRKKENNLI